MCGRGVLWRIDATSADTVLAERSHFARTLANHAGWRVDAASAEMIFTELVTNVLQYGRSPVSVWLDCSDNRVRLHVLEHGPGFGEEPELPDPLSEGGRGLFLASRLSSELSIEGDPRGTHIVATLRGGP